MDKKISELNVATTILATDLLPIVTGGTNKSVTAGVLSLNMPNLGNKGITKNVIVQADTLTGIIPLTNTFVTLPALEGYVLPAGTPGQQITLIALGNTSVNYNTSYIVSIQTDKSVTFFFTTKWIIIAQT